MFKCSNLISLLQQQQQQKQKEDLKKKKKKNTATFFFEKPNPKAWEIYSTKTKLMNISKHKGSNVIR